MAFRWSLRDSKSPKFSIIIIIIIIIIKKELLLETIQLLIKDWFQH